eukprot:263446-Ditylum_brightwellii.AAC.1
MAFLFTMEFFGIIPVVSGWNQEEEIIILHKTTIKKDSTMGSNKAAKSIYWILCPIMEETCNIQGQTLNNEATRLHTTFTQM